MLYSIRLSVRLMSRISPHNWGRTSAEDRAKKGTPWRPQKEYKD